MNEFIYLASLNNRNISLQIIKSFSVLILNLSNTTTLYYMFSNNFINQIISNDYEKYDDDFISYYVNFLKSLSLKIDTTTIQFFYHKQHNSFPLLQASLKLYNHNDAMIKNTVRNVVLTVLKSTYFLI
jgi:protein CLEC16A